MFYLISPSEWSCKAWAECMHQLPTCRLWKENSGRRTGGQGQNLKYHQTSGEFTTSPHFSPFSPKSGTGADRKHPRRGKGSPDTQSKRNHCGFSLFCSLSHSTQTLSQRQLQPQHHEAPRNPTLWGGRAFFSNQRICHPSGRGEYT